MNTAQHLTPQPPVAPLRDADHYVHLLGRAKWYILISGPAVLLVALALVFLVIRPENPELTARALIGLERTTIASGAKEGITANLGREDIMMSRTFLRDVVRKLSLQVWTAPYGREEMFDSVSIDSTAPCGTYRVRFDPQSDRRFQIVYYDTTQVSLPLYGFLPGSAYRTLATGNWAADASVDMPGMSLKLSRSLRTRPRAFTFKVVDIRVAVEVVYRNLTIKRADPDKGINYIAVLLAGRDYSLAAATANAIADAFIEKNSSFRKQRTRGVVGTLDKQLQLSQANLASAEAMIRDFRSQNPQVGLNQQTQQTVSGLAQLDNGIQNMSTDIANATRLRDEYLNKGSTQRLQVAGEIAEMLSAHNVPAGKTLSEDLNRLLARQRDLAGTYGAEHPLVLENNSAIEKVSWGISAALNEFIRSGQTTVSMKQQGVQQLSSSLRRLPALEMRLGELQRNQKIYEDIYSAVLNNFNQAKVADAVETADFYVMDYAVAPLPPPADPSKLLIICVLIAVLSSFGPVLVMDFFDKSARSQRQIGRITGNLVLEAIPIFSQVDGKRRMGKPAPHPLVNVDCDPSFTRELFDSLLVKIKLRMFESPDHCIVVSSFEGGCGKSTISSNLAIAMALHGHRTLLVDGDLRCGTVKEIFGLPDSPGLAGLLSSPTALTDEDFVRSIVDSEIPGLYVLPSGPEPANPGALLSSRRMEEFRRFCAKHVAYTVMDTPPLGVVSDAVVAQKLFAHYMFVVRSGKTKVGELVSRINEFDQLSGKILGYVLNGASHDAVGTYRRYSKYYMKSAPTIEAKRISVIRSTAIILSAVVLVFLGVAGIMIASHLSRRSSQTESAATHADPTPGQSPNRLAQPAIEASQPAPMAVADQPERAATPRIQSGIPATSSGRKKIEAQSAATTGAPSTAPKSAALGKRGTTASEPKMVDSTEIALSTLQEIRSKFAQGDLAGLGPIFDRPAVEDGEYHVLMARYLCETGGWRKALPILEMALSTPARALTRDQLAKEYFFCRAKCFDAAFGAEPTPARGAAAMDAWYSVKYQYRDSPQGSRYSIADSKLRRISEETRGK